MLKRNVSARSRSEHIEPPQKSLIRTSLGMICHCHMLASLAYFVEILVNVMFRRHFCSHQNPVSPQYNAASYLRLPSHLVAFCACQQLNGALVFSILPFESLFSAASLKSTLLREMPQWVSVTTSALHNARHTSPLNGLGYDSAGPF